MLAGESNIEFWGRKTIAKGAGDENLPSKDTGTQASNRRRGYLGDIHRAHDRSLSDTKTSDEASCVDGCETAFRATGHKDRDTHGPKCAEEPGCPDTADTIANQERTVEY